MMWIAAGESPSSCLNSSLLTCLTGNLSPADETFVTKAQELRLAAVYRSDDGRLPATIQRRRDTPQDVGALPNGGAAWGVPLASVVEEVMGEYLRPRVRLRPGDVARRHEASWRGLTAESVQFTASEGFEYDFTAPCHLLIAADRGIRIRGESRVDGVVASSRRDIGRTLTFIPKGYVFRGSFVPRVLPKTGYLYIDPAAPLADPELGFAYIEFEPWLFFTDAALWTTATKILGLVESPEGSSRLYAETLAASLAIELSRLQSGSGQAVSAER